MCFAIWKGALAIPPNCSWSKIQVIMFWLNFVGTHLIMANFGVGETNLPLNIFDGSLKFFDLDCFREGDESNQVKWYMFPFYSSWTFKELGYPNVSICSFDPPLLVGFFFLCLGPLLVDRVVFLLCCIREMMIFSLILVS